MRILIALMAVGSLLAACGEAPECQPIEKVMAGSGEPQGKLTVKAYLRIELNGREKEVNIKAPFQVENSEGNCFCGVTTKHLKLAVGYWAVTALDLTDEAELARIRRRTNNVGDFLTPDTDRLPESDIDVTDGMDGHRIFYYLP